MPLALLTTLVFANAVPSAGDALHSDAVLFLDEPDVPSLLRYLRARPASPLVARANFLLGTAYVRAGRYEDAVLAFELARSQMGELGDFVSLRLGEALMKGGFDDAAYRVLDELMQKPLETATKEDVAELLAAVCFRLGKAERAADLLHQLLVKTADEPRLVRLLMMQADWYAKTHNTKEAIAAYKRVWIHYPHFPESETARMLALRLGEQTKAPAALDLEEKLLRASELARLGRDEEGEDLLLAVLAEHKHELTPERRARVILRRASSAIRRKLPEVAVELCQLLLDKPLARTNREHRHSILHVLGRAYSQLQRYPEAAKVMETLAAESTNPKVRKDSQLLHAVLVRDSGKVKEARELFERFISAYGNDPKAHDARWFLGWSYYRAGELEQAIKTWHVVVERNPSSLLVPRLLYWTARVHERQGRMAEARAAYERAGADDPWTYYAWLSGERLAQLGSVKKPSQAEASTPPVEPAIARGDMSLVRLAAGAIPQSLKAFSRASLFWQLGLYGEASRAMRDVPIPEGGDDALLLAQLHEKLEDHFRGFVIAQKRFGKVLREPLELPAGAQASLQRSALELAYPRAFDRYVAPAAQRFKVPSELVFAVMRQESTFKTEAKSWADAQGLLQLIPKTAQRIAREIGEPAPSSFVAPPVNIRLGTAYLSRLLATFSGHPALAAAAYNAGPFSVDQWLLRLGALDFDEFVEEIPYRETRDYVKKVVANFAAYRRIYQHARTPIAGYFEPMPAASRGLIDY